MEDGAPLTAPPPTYTPKPERIGLYGWRKRCLYLLILLLVVVILVNLGLTIWILVVLDFNTNGMGNLEITESGIRLDGPAEFVGPLYVQNISADQGSPLRLFSQDNITMTTSDGSSIQLGNSSLNILADQFSVLEQGGGPAPLLSVQAEGVTVGTSAGLEVTGALGVTVAGPLEASQVQSPSNQDLQLQALSGELHLTGGRGISLRDGPGFEGVSVSSNSDLTITSLNGQVVLEGETVKLRGVPRTAGSDRYEVCVCGTQGTLYLLMALLEEVPLSIPVPLKKVLEDDCFWVQRRAKLYHLPADQNVESVLREYYYTCLETSTEDTNFQLLSEVLDGIKIYFDFTLADHLLYRPEKEQHKQLGITNPVLTKKQSHLGDDNLNAESGSEPSTCGGRLPSQVYGPVHLLRLFVKLPHFLSCTHLPPSHVQLLHTHFRELLGYMSSRRQDLFSEEQYYDTVHPTPTGTNSTEETVFENAQTHKT